MQACEVEQLLSVGVQALRQPFMKKHFTLVTMPMDFITSEDFHPKDEIIDALQHTVI